jgi:lauroyl/myristoyl acyltransferase
LYPIASNPVEPNFFKKFVDYNIELRLFSRIPYKTSCKAAYDRGIKISSYFKDDLMKMQNNISKLLNKNSSDALQTAKEVFAFSSMEEMDAVRIGLKQEKFIQDCVIVENTEYIDEVIKKGTGGIIALMHEGSFASVLCKLGYSYGFKVNALAWPYFEAECPVFRSFLERKINGMCYFMNGEFFYVGHINVKKFYSKIINKELIAIVLDSPLGNSAKVPINFLGVNFEYPFTALKVALKTKCPLIPVFTFRDKNDLKIKSKVFEPIYIEHKDEIPVKMQLFFNVLEKELIKYPHEFFYWTSPTCWNRIDV